MLAVAVADNSPGDRPAHIPNSEAPNTASDLLYKNALDDQSRSNFLRPDPRFDPALIAPTRIRSPESPLRAMTPRRTPCPAWRIEAERSCAVTHGATSGQIDEEEFFYLRSRGIPLKTRNALIVHGFIDEVLTRLGDDDLAGGAQPPAACEV
jgi:Fe-S cluster assembly protein SufD